MSLWSHTHLGDKKYFSIFRSLSDKPKYTFLIRTFERNEKEVWTAMTKQRVVMKEERFALFRSLLDDIHNSLISSEDDEVVDVGGGYIVSVIPGLKKVDIRGYVIPIGKVRLYPTEMGIALTFEEFEILKLTIERIAKENKVIYDMKPCQHKTEKERLECIECTPFPKFVDLSI